MLNDARAAPPFVPSEKCISVIGFNEVFERWATDPVNGMDLTDEIHHRMEPHVLGSRFDWSCNIIFISVVAVTCHESGVNIHK